MTALNIKLKKASSFVARLSEDAEVRPLGQDAAITSLDEHRTIQIKVRFTRDYVMFILPAEQRAASEKSIQDLRKSFLHMGIFMPENALFCTPIYHEDEVRLMVMDGQHRLHALIREGMEVPYFLVHLDPDQIHVLQKGAGSWTPNDYYVSYATQGLEPYKMLRKVHEERRTPYEKLLLYLANKNDDSLPAFKKKAREKKLPAFEEKGLTQWCHALVQIKAIRKKHSASSSYGGYGLERAFATVFTHPDMTSSIWSKMLARYDEDTRKLPVGKVFRPGQERKALEGLVDLLNYGKTKNLWGVGTEDALRSPQQVKAIEEVLSKR